MKRKLIAFEAFKKINESSLSTAETELTNAADVLAKALNTEHLKLHCFGADAVTYETVGKTYIHATYQIKNNSVLFENIEELVVSDESAKQEARKLVGNMVESLLNNNDSKASEVLAQYLDNPTIRREFIEGCTNLKEKKKCGMKMKKMDKGNKLSENVVFKKQPKKLHNWSEVARNVIGYLEFQEFGPTMNNSQVKTDEKGNVVAVKIPTTHTRNEGKVLALNYKHMLDSEVKVLRGKMKQVQEDSSFCHAMSDLRKANAISDEAAVLNVIEAVVRKWPDLVYITQKELASSIATALEAVNCTNYDDEVCEFLAEGLLRTATEVFSEKIERIVRLSGNTLNKEAVYESFQNIAEKFYTSIDESSKLEMQVFVDLYNSLVEVHGHAKAEGNDAVRTEANNFLKELYAVLQEEQEPTSELVKEAASWLKNLVEANSEDWEVSNTPFQTVNGDNPEMNKKANKSYAPSKDFDPENAGTAPVSNGKTYKSNGLEDEMRNNAWGNWSSDNTWPSLNNPYVPKAMDYKMKEKSAVDDGDNDWSKFQSKDTWPNLDNPNQKPSPWDHKKANSDNLVVDK